MAESDSRGDGEAAEIELTYSTTGGISRAKPALGTLKLCIIQVPLFVVNEVVERIKDGTITNVVYDPKTASLVEE